MNFTLNNHLSYTIGDSLYGSRETPYEKFKVNRRSCQQYEVQNGVPKCPLGRTGIYGRGNLYFYGPNYCILAIFKRFL